MPMTKSIDFRLIVAGLVFSLLILAAYLIEIPHFRWVEKLLNIDYVSCNINFETNSQNILKVLLIYLGAWLFIALIIFILLKYIYQGKYLDKFKIIFFSSIFIASIFFNYYLATNVASQSPFGFCGHYIAKMTIAIILGLAVSIYITRKNA